MDELEGFIENAFSLVMSGYYRTRGERTRKMHSLKSSLADTRTIPVIAEFKRRTPSVREMSSGVDLGQRLADFVSAGVCGLSILTEPYRFDGSIDNLRRAASYSLPVLMKDFVIATDQIDAAYASGADAVLLIMEIFESTRYSMDVLMESAHSYGMEVVIEVNSTEQFEKAKGTDAEIIGINNRDLRTLRLEEGRSERILSSVSKDRPVIGMSGIRSAERVKSILAAGADGVLVGTSLMGDDTELLKSIREAVLQRRK
jgi:indole-3-glycerol phosphate synthase